MFFSSCGFYVRLSIQSDFNVLFFIKILNLKENHMQQLIVTRSLELKFQLNGRNLLFYEFAMLFEELEEKLLFLLQHHPVSSMGKYSFSFPSLFSLQEMFQLSVFVHLIILNITVRTEGRETFQVHVVTESLHKVTWLHSGFLTLNYHVSIVEERGKVV